MRAPEIRAKDLDDIGILWHESQNTYQPRARSLADFLATIECTSPVSIPQPEADPSVLVFANQRCFDAMYEHAHCDILREQAGILCGEAYQDSSQLYLDVNSAVPVDTISNPVHFQFHERSWESVWKQCENKAILGWYHTHPGFGIFLSPTDLRTQANYFAARWQITVVIDPISREFGIFDGKGKLLGRESNAMYSYNRK